MSSSHCTFRREKRKVKKVKNKKKLRRKNDNKNGSGYVCSSACVAAIASVLSAGRPSPQRCALLPAWLKDGRGQQCTTEFSSSISPQAGGERTATLILARKPSAMSFQGMHFFRE